MKAPTFKDWLQKSKVGGVSSAATSKAPIPLPIIVLQVVDNDIDNAASSISEAVECIHQSRGTVFHIISSILIAAFDTSEGEAHCKEAIHGLRGLLGEKGKALYGIRNAPLGNFGSATRVSYGPFIQGLPDLFFKLRQIDFGSYCELESPNI